MVGDGYISAALRRLKASAALAATLLVAYSPHANAAFDLQFNIAPSATFSPNQLAILNAALPRVEQMWETVVTGYQPGISIPPVQIEIRSMTSGLASANYLDTEDQNGMLLTKSGYIFFNVNEIVNFANWQGISSGPCIIPPTNLNYIDEVLAHETGHVLGIGTLWAANSLYVNGTFQYTGAHGVAAYQQEFDAGAAFVPVENNGGAGTPNSHWDQTLRSSAVEGDPNAPYCLDPRIGVVDNYGRDLGLEMMSGAIDPDYLEPFLSRTTVESMRDLGYTVAAFEDFDGDGTVTLADLAILETNFNVTGLQIDSIAYGDADRDRDVDGHDLMLWQRAFVSGGGSRPIPEPASVLLAGIALLAMGRARR